jgi:regulator of CtrA degradation
LRLFFWPTFLGSRTAVAVINLFLNITLCLAGPERIVAMCRDIVWRDRDSGMQGRHNMTQSDSSRSNTGKTIRLADAQISTERFGSLYSEGMSLVEETADYLDGNGRVQARGLSRMTSTLYAAESMRLTTRLMQIASWLLLQRASRNGEMSHDQVASEKQKVRLDTRSSREKAENWGELPEMFRDLVERSLRLQARVRKLDDALYNAETEGAGEQRSPVNDQLELLKTAFAHS